MHIKVDMCVKFHISRMIFIFFNCYQLSSAVENCWQLMTADMKKTKLTGIFMHILNLRCVPNFSSAPACCDLNHLNTFAELCLKYPNPDPA